MQKEGKAEEPQSEHEKAPEPKDAENKTEKNEGKGKEKHSLTHSISKLLHRGLSLLDPRQIGHAIAPGVGGVDRCDLPTNGTGLCGLYNLGNTCYMNSALQCLSHTPPLTQYFLSDEYRGALNTTNPLGTKGKLAEQYAYALKNMWSGKRSFSPQKLKGAISRFAPRFSGYAQHDSQEFLGFLLDGLHEDVNLIEDKPYVEIDEESDSKLPDYELAELSWQRHTMRNQSVITDYFQAQLKSTLTCPRCKYVSVIFDPFMYLSLPIPAKGLFEATIFNPLRPGHVERFGAWLSRDASVSDFLNEIAEASGLPVTCLYLATVERNRLSHYKAKDSLQFMPIRTSVKKVYIYCLHPIPSFPQSQLLHVVQRYIKNKRPVLSGIPFAARLPTQINGKQLHFFIWKRLQSSLPRTERNPLFFTDEACQLDQERVEDPETFWAWVERESENLDPETLPFQLFYANAMGLRCSCKKTNCSGCPLPTDDTVVRLGLTYHVAAQWKQEVPSRVEDAPAVIDSPSLQALQAKYKTSSVSLEDCLQLFSESEVLGEKDMWYCPKCKSHVQATKKMDLWNAPEVLIIHLKRFSHRTRSKISTAVQYPLEGLNLEPFLLDPKSQSGAVYDLYAISMHSGSLSGGHYTAAAKIENGRWYMFNDSSVSEIVAPSGTSGSSYLLFYQKRTPKPKNSSRVTDLSVDSKTETDNSQHSDSSQSQPNVGYDGFVGDID